MPEAAKLGTDDFILADFRCCEMKGDVQAGDEILLDAQFRDIERVAHVFGVHEQVNLAVHRNGHLSGYDVVFGILVVCSVEAKEVCIAFTDLVGVQRAKLSIRTGVAEIKCELSSLDLNRDGIGCGRSEIDAGPRLYPKHPQS